MLYATSLFLIELTVPCSIQDFIENKQKCFSSMWKITLTNKVMQFCRDITMALRSIIVYAYYQDQLQPRSWSHTKYSLRAFRMIHLDCGQHTTKANWSPQLCNKRRLVFLTHTMFSFIARQLTLAEVKRVCHLSIINRCLCFPDSVSYFKEIIPFVRSLTHNYYIRWKAMDDVN